MGELNVATVTRRPEILLVDSQEVILQRLQQLLSPLPYTLHFARDATQALQLLASREVDLVISAAHLPQMDGPTLLARIHQQYPSTTRILLTGDPDLKLIAKAINEGEIYRYLSKPWDDQELLLALRQALEHQHSERERLRLQDLAQQQNAELKALNTLLEKRVAARTSELQQTADMLDLAYEELKPSYATGAELFSLLVNQRLPADKQTNRRIIELVRAYCKVQGIDPGAQRDLAMAAALHNIGKLSWSDSMMTSPADLLHHHQRERYRAYPAQSESLLMTLEPVQDAARLIRHHQEHWDGSGFPDHLKGDAIPLGSRLLKLAVDFIELQCGLILERHMNSDEALVFIRKYAGRLYDPDLVEGFIQVCAVYLSDVTLGDPSVKVLSTRELAAGMILARNLNADNGMLLLNAGKVLNLPLVDKLIAFETMEGARYSVFVKLPQEQQARA
ncbi:two-component system response regulator [Pseudomonas protegens]|jgi:response regulator RpfG family c-di-GMP phosphodiesterase|uniref:Response regulator/HD domain protein n=5 Tax=Pseudomonas protegens TaxID=380021 RepID=Q4K707_PSEF5|nr:HD domain-containing phosphohydrolase [Pseudomonas protegens]AAY94125.1 response regulator/HD domain protein [Pseudomonas protegens Pf-5]ASE21699.1 two-component system response regulator [Pseudomonas protegens]QEZ54616.1 two-component system response regulator [Pseudomonas protegens]QEZ59184.1 two-component system response regulator [Pseudomonas protegens]QEZ65904.1 two-component system response regulator [Pseudomonas protegens]